MWLTPSVTNRYCDPVMATGWHMVLGSLPLLAVSAAQEGPELASRLSQLTGAPAAASATRMPLQRRLAWDSGRAVLLCRGGAAT